MNFIKSHKFFVKETPKYLGKMTLKRILYYPIAYIKFMWLEFKG